MSAATVFTSAIFVATVFTLAISVATIFTLPIEGATVLAVVVIAVSIEANKSKLWSFTFIESPIPE